MSKARRKFLKQASALPFFGLVPSLCLRANEEQHLKLLLSEQSHDWFGSDYAPIQLWETNTELIRLKQHVPVTIEVENRLPDQTSMHWHGLRVPNAMDGVSGLTQKPIEPGETFVYRFNPIDAGTFWAHAHHNTYEQLARGLYLPLIVEEANDYSVDAELLLVVDDWRINDVGQIDIASLGSLRDWGHGGRLGNIITVNRQLNPRLGVQPGQRVRLRILNSANARVMVIKLPEMASWIIAKDGQPLLNPEALQSELVLSPAERYDVIIDIPESGSAERPIQVMNRDEAFDIASFFIEGNGIKAGSPATPPALPQNFQPNILNGEPDHTVRLEMEGGAMGRMREATYKGELLTMRELMQNKQLWAFNGVAGMPDSPLVRAKTGEIVEIDIINNTRWMHGMHLHGHHFMSNSERYATDLWHDTLLMQGRETVKIRFKAGETGKWLLHCHMIEHQVAGMRTWIEVVS